MSPRNIRQVAPDPLHKCGLRLRLHHTRWNNCSPNASSTRGWESVAKRLRDVIVLLNASVVILGDSVLRDQFVMATCILYRLGALRFRPDFMSRAHYGTLNEIAHARLKVGGPALGLSFIWSHRVCLRYSAAGECKQQTLPHSRINFTRNVAMALQQVYGGSGNSSRRWVSVISQATHVLYGGHAFASSAQEVAANLNLTMTWLNAHRGPHTEVALVEYLPSHFPAQPYGEYRRHEDTRVHSTSQRGARCTPHDATLSAGHPEVLFRRTIVNEYASSRRLRLLRGWDLARDNHDDHPVNKSFADPEFGVLDCRHWCSPGRTMLNAVGVLANFLGERAS